MAFLSLQQRFGGAVVLLGAIVCGLPVGFVDAPAGYLQEATTMEPRPAAANPYPLLAPADRDGARLVRGAVFTPRILSRISRRTEPREGDIPSPRRTTSQHVLIAWDYLPQAEFAGVKCTAKLDPVAATRVDVRPSTATQAPPPQPVFVASTPEDIDRLLGDAQPAGRRFFFVAGFRQDRLPVGGFLMWSFPIDCGELGVKQFETGVFIGPEDVASWQ